MKVGIDKMGVDPFFLDHWSLHCFLHFNGSRGGAAAPWTSGGPASLGRLHGTYGQLTKDESFQFFGRNFGFRWPAIERGGRNVEGRNFAEFRLKSEKKSPKNGCRRKIGEIFKKSPDTAIYRRIFGLYRRFFSDFSGNFPIFPTSPARAQDTKSDHDLQAKVDQILYPVRGLDW